MNQLLKISEFAYLSGISRKNLIYYHQIGLLLPERVLENNYRLYSYHQLETVSFIGALQEFGMSLAEIKNHLDSRAPSALIELFSAQKKQVREKIRHLHRIQAMIDTRLLLTRKALETDPDSIILRECAAESLYASDKITCAATEAALENAATEFYYLCNNESLIYGYPLGTIIAKDDILRGDFRYPAHYFFKVPVGEGKRTRLIKPAGLYLIGFERATYSSPKTLYDRMLDYICEHNLCICGNSYEEFLLDEIAVKHSSDHLLQVSIQVEHI